MRCVLVWAGTILALALALLLALSPLVPKGSAPPGTHDALDSAGRTHTPDLSALPLAFEPNAGQTDQAVRFQAHTLRGTLFFTPGAVMLVLAGSGSTTDMPAPAAGGGHLAALAPPQVVQLRFDGANPQPVIDAAAPLTSRVSYFHGKDPSHWQANLPTYGTLTYHALYPGIDLEYTGSGGRLKGTFLVQAGADPERIRWYYGDCGVESGNCGTAEVGAAIDATGALQVRLGGGTSNGVSITEEAPAAWQEIDGQQVPVAVRYAVAADGRVRLVLGTYDTSRPLTIDPTLTYATYLGGSGREEEYHVARDSTGNIYLTGFTASSNFPLANPVQPQYGGGTFDGFVVKLDPAGTTLLYSTYLGGSGLDMPVRLALDSAGNAYVAGRTTSTDFPVANALQPQYGGGSSDGFVAKLSPTGATLVYSTYLGGSNWDQGLGIAVDPAGDAYFTGDSLSTNYPVANAFQPTNHVSPGTGYGNVVLTKLNPAGSALVYSTYLGGSTGESAYDIAVSAAGAAYVTGYTHSTDFPLYNPFQPACRDCGLWSGDAFVSAFTPAGTALLYSTFLGGSAFDSGWGIAVDAGGDAYVAGDTTSGDFPLANAFQSTNRGGYDLFLTKLNPSGSALSYSTYLGGSNDDRYPELAVDPAGFVYLTGRTASTDFPLLNPLQPTYAGGSDDSFVTAFNAAGSALTFSTYLGGSGADMGTGITRDSLGILYLTGWTDSSNFPTVNPLQPHNAGGTDAYLAKIDPNPLPLSPTVTPTAGPASPTATPTPDCGGTWSRVNSPNYGSGNNYLMGVASAGAADSWAVGYNGSQGIVERWDGSQWTASPHPNVGTNANYLLGVTAVASDNVWTVGAYNSGGPDQTLALHWNGSTWTVVPTANTGYGYNQLHSLAGVAPDDLWAVGYADSDINQTQTLIEHWDGAIWTIVPSPNGGTGLNFLNSVTVATANDAWAVGSFSPQGGGPTHTLILHWDGAQWQATPNTPAGWLTGVKAIAADDVWVVGYHLGSPYVLTLTMHWNGVTWSVVPSVDPQPGSSFLTGVAGTATNDVWAVGDYNPPNAGPTQTLMEHWDGSQWRAVPNTDFGVLNAVSQAANGQYWGVGFVGNYGFYQTLIERFVPHCLPATATPTRTPMPPTSTPSTTQPPSATPTRSPAATATQTEAPVATATARPTETLTSSPTRTGTPSPTLSPSPPPSATAMLSPTPPPLPTASRTATALPLATLTPEASPTSCVVNFSDVYPTDYFYPAVAYLACHGVLSGYADGTFRPFQPTTRGQQVKIVVLGFGIPLYTPPAGGASFADVPPSQPFFLYIETAAHSSLVSGYACGGPGEPCDAQNRPYFRPYADVTRGQLAKITVLGRGWGLIAPVTARFADVPLGSAFYEFVETAACHGLISGYTCGGPGEPCDAQQRPYFRPGGDATRGQIAKIIYGGLGAGTTCSVPTATK